MRELKEFVIREDKLTEERVMARLTKIILFQLLAALMPAAVVIWQLAGINANANASLDLLKHQQDELDKRAKWMQERQRWEDSVEMWAGPKGYIPPRYKTLPEQAN